MTERRLASLERDLLDRLISRFEEAPRHPQQAPLDAVDPSLLSSGWQKAIRRGDVETAQRAVISLHGRDPGYIWRRLRGIALEEVSVADLELVGQVLAIAGKQIARQKLGDLALALHLTGRLAKADKCRTACDLLMWVGVPDKKGIAPLPPLPLATPAPLLTALQQAHAWLSITARSGYVQGRWAQLVAGDLRRRDELLEQSDCPPLVEFIVRRGSSTDALNTLLVPVYYLSQHRGDRLRMLDRIPESSRRVGALPSYAYCLFSGPGRAALRRLLQGELGHFCRQAGITDPLRSVGHSVFQVEGGYCRDVLQVGHAQMIRHRYEQATLLRYGTHLHVQGELRRQVIAHLPDLFEHRLQVYRADQARLVTPDPLDTSSPGHVEEARPVYGPLHRGATFRQCLPTHAATKSDPRLGGGLRAKPYGHVEDLDTS